jgi:low temperature requirement protein LtrA
MRDHTVHDRAATPLELFFDLCFVVAVAVLAADLHHGVADGHPWDAAATYGLLFVPIWWAWMSFTWFATAFDHDDPVHRVLTMLQMAGVLAVAATAHRAAVGEVVPFALAYTAMRVPLVLQWLRAARHDPAHRRFATTYATGLAGAQVLWVLGALLSGPLMAVVFLLALVTDLLTPVLAVHRAPGPVFHAGHIAERYGLFTLIVLGETVLAVTLGLQETVEGEVALRSAVPIVVAALVVVFASWWIYFDTLGRDGLTRNRRAAFVWGYGHYLLYAALAAAGAGVQAQLELVAHDGQDTARAALAVPVALALAAIGGLQVAANRRLREARAPLAGSALCALVAAVPTDAAASDLAVAAVVVAVLLATPRPS